MNIRRATPDDAEPLAKLHIDSWRAAYRGLVPDGHLDSLDYRLRAQRFRDSLAQNAEESYLAEQNGEILGFVTLGACRDADVDQDTSGEIWGIYLAPGHWRKGIGTSLCRYAERLLRTRGYRSALLWAFAENPQARRFYEAMGFKADGATRTLNPGAALKAVRYRRELGKPK
ncbi:MAG: GNAT family N-acetyltransferase [Candidatus Eisenbacteria bacterium]|nr:GNAT family N-acetyltransferase [Candidatus Eisenbacteria bacterium]